MSANQGTQGIQGIPSYIDRTAVLSLLLNQEPPDSKGEPISAEGLYVISEILDRLRKRIENLPAFKPQPMVESQGVVMSSDGVKLCSSIELLHIANVTLGQRYEDGEDPLAPCFSALDRAIEIVRADSSRTIQKMLELLLANQHFKREVDRLRTEILRATRDNAKVVEGLKKEIAERAEHVEPEGPTNLKAQVGQPERERAELSSDNQRLRAEIKRKNTEIAELQTRNAALLGRDKRTRAFVAGIERLLKLDRFDRTDMEELLIVLRSNSSAPAECPECANLRAVNEKATIQFDEEKRGFLHKIAKLEAERDQRNGFQAAMFKEWRKAFEKIWPRYESGLSPEQYAPYMADEILKMRAERDKFEAAYHRAEKEFAALEASKKEADSELRRMGREAGELRVERSKLFWEKEELRKFAGMVRNAMWPEDLKNALAQIETGTAQPSPVAEPIDAEGGA